MGKKLVIMVCIAAMIMTNLPDWSAGADVSGTAPSEAGDTVVGNARLGSKEIIMGDRFIENETLWNDTVITLNGNLTVNETGSLTLDNVTLLMNCSFNGEYHIKVQSGGEMYILNNSNISSANEYRYLFWVRNDSKFEMRDSELHGCGYEWGGTMDLAGLWINTNDTIFENDIFSNNGGGIIFYQSHNNIITNTNITNNDVGISLDASSNNSISNCNIYSNDWQGIFISSAYGLSNNNIIRNSNISNNNNGVVLGMTSNNTISNCTISSNNNTGIYIEDSSNNEIIDCNISDNNAGIHMLHSTGTSVKDCNFSNNTYGTVVDSSSDTTITECDYISNGNTVYSRDWDGLCDRLSINVTVLSPAGITCWKSSDTEISDCVIFENEKGICLQNSSNTNISDTVISSNNETGIYLVSSSNTLIVNSNISGNYSNPDYHDISLSSDSHLNLLNTTFTNVSFADNASTLNVSWYLNVNVLWNNSIPAEYANVSIQDFNCTFDLINRTTDKLGWVRNIVVQEYTQNHTNTTYFIPYNVNASQMAFWNLTSIPITNTTELLLYLNQPFPHNAPVISNISTVLPEYDEDTTVEFKFNVFHPDNLTLTYRWYLNNTDTFNETEVKNDTLENTNITQEINWVHWFDFASHGNYTVKVEVFDGNATVSCEWVFTINNINGRPEIEYYYPPKNIILGNHSRVIFNVTASDPDMEDELTYQWKVTGEGLIEVVDNQTCIFYAVYNASENATNTYLIELVITDNGIPPLSVNHTWTVIVVDWNASYDYLLLQIELLKAAVENITKLIGNITETLLNQTELLENITWLVENITALNMTVLKDKLTQLFIELENMNITLAQLNENLTRIQEELNNAMDKIGNLTAMLENANATRDDAIDAMNSAISDKEDAENEAEQMENRMNEAIKAKNKAEYKLAASVVISVIAGIIAGFLISFLLRRKLPKKG